MVSFFEFLRVLPELLFPSEGPAGYNQFCKECGSPSYGKELCTRCYREQHPDYKKNSKVARFKPKTPTQSGTLVRSGQEQTLADFLTAQGLPFIYEKALPMSPTETLHPDFFIKGPVYFNGRLLKNVYIEHCGMKGRAAYDKKTQYTYDLYCRFGVTVIYTYPDDLRGSCEGLIMKLATYKEHRINFYRY